ncbi:MAG: sodium-translocating pyrophosphatase [Candidatus Thorarchaeota archaeon]
MMDLAYISIIVGIFSMLIVCILIYLVLRIDEGTVRMKEVASFIRTGANAFMRREFLTISFFIVGLAILLGFILKWQIAVSFVIGAIISLLAAFIGMSLAVRTNVRTANVARQSGKKAVVVAFRGGAVTGLSIVGLGLIGVGSLFLIFGDDATLLVGFGVGASLAALFAQLGGGIYTKAADVGADLVGKVEHHLPEDDARNPASIADLVGDNVGDCAGRGADLFESFSDNMIGAMILGIAFVSVYGYNAIIFPLLVESVGIIGSIVGVFSIRASKTKPATKVYLAFGLSGIISIIGLFPICYWLMHDMRLFYCLLLGLGLTLIVALVVLYYTATGWKVTRKIAEGAKSGSAIDLILGLAYGLESPAIPVVTIGLVSVAAYFIAGGGFVGIYGISAAVMGVLISAGIIMASDAFGPIADNAEGIASMSELTDEVGSSLEELDGVGNVTKAVTKGYAMATAILTAVLILFAYLTQAADLKGIVLEHIDDIPINLSNPIAIAAMFIGAVIPFLFSALAIKAVGKTAFKMSDEVRRQFEENPGILTGESNADYTKCVDISTKNSLKAMILPTLLGIVTPIAMGFIVGVWNLAVYLLAVKVVSGILAMFMYNAGGAFDNAKKYIELGHNGGKYSKAHEASVIGDTVGDPLKDTAGPSLHILVKLQNILSIMLLPLLVTFALI